MVMSRGQGRTSGRRYYMQRTHTHTLNNVSLGDAEGEEDSTVGSSIRMRRSQALLAGWFLSAQQHYYQQAAGVGAVDA